MIGLRVLQTDFFGDHNLGLFAKSSDSLSLIGSRVSGRKIQDMEKILGVDVIQASIANSEIVGIFCVLNSKGIIVPRIVTSEETRYLKMLASERGMSFGTMNSRFTAIGNLVLCNDEGAIVSKILSKGDKKMIGDFLDVETEYGTIAGLNNVGSCGIATNKGCLLHRDASEKELDETQKILKVDTDIGTANFGSPFVGSCGIASSKGAVLGDSTTGPEVTRIMEALDLL